VSVVPITKSESTFRGTPSPGKTKLWGFAGDTGKKSSKGKAPAGGERKENWAWVPRLPLHSIKQLPTSNGGRRRGLSNSPKGNGTIDTVKGR